MKKSSRLKTSLSLLLVSVLAATIMPTSVNAETTEFEDNVVTVEVDLGSDGPEPELCTGLATLNVPDEDVLTAELNRRVTRVESPDLYDVLQYRWGDYDEDANWSDDYTLEVQAILDTYNGLGFNAALYRSENSTLPEGQFEAIRYTPIVIDEVTYHVDEDLDTDGDIDANDAPDGLTQTRRNYSTNWFTVEYDASDCLDSYDMGLVLVARGPVSRFDDEQDETPSNAEIDWEMNLTDLQGNGEAWLRVKTDLLGGLISLPYTVAWSATTDSLFGEDAEPVAFGDEGAAEMRSMLDIYGSSPTGIYMVQYHYQLEVNEEDYFEGLYGLGCVLLGPCLP
jgi:hypothetical protein